MSPENHPALAKNQHKASMIPTIMTLCLVPVLLLLTWWVTLQPEFRQHFWGDSIKVEGTIVAVSEGAPFEVLGCQRGDGWRLSVEWTEDGRTRTHDVKDCGRDRPTVGSTTSVWSTDNGAYADSPGPTRVLVGFLFAAVAGSILGLVSTSRASRRVAGGRAV